MLALYSEDLAHISVISLIVATLLLLFVQSLKIYKRTTVRYEAREERFLYDSSDYVDRIKYMLGVNHVCSLLGNIS